MKNILNTIVLLEIISVMCVRHTASFKNNYRGIPITKLFNTPKKKDNDGETPDRRPAAATRLPPLNHRQCITSLQNCKSPGIAITALWGPYILKSKCQRWKSKKNCRDRMDLAVFSYEK